MLSAIGRKPVTDALQLDKAGVKVDAQGLVQVDAFENTSAPNVFALGDCTTTGFELTPVAIAAGRRLADRLFGGEPRAITLTLSPTVTLSPALTLTPTPNPNPTPTQASLRRGSSMRVSPPSSSATPP